MSIQERAFCIKKNIYNELLLLNHETHDENIKYISNTMIDKLALELNINQNTFNYCNLC